MAWPPRTGPARPGPRLWLVAREEIAQAVTEVNGRRYRKAVHTFAATTFGKIPADELELFQQGRAADPPAGEHDHFRLAGVRFGQQPGQVWDQLGVGGSQPSP